MISFRTRNESYAEPLLIAAILIAIGTAAWFSRPLPTEVAKAPKSTASIQSQIDKANKNYQESESEISALVWTDTPDQIQPKAVSSLTAIAKKRGMKLVNIHPGKSVEGQGLMEIPFALTLEGPFPNAVQFVKDLEQPNLKLAVSTVQVASADAASDRVTETVNVLAYLRGTTASASTGDKNAKKSK